MNIAPFPFRSTRDKIRNRLHKPIDFRCTPLPTIKRVPFDEVRNHLPPDTPVVTPAQREEELRERIRACQRRRRW